MAKREPILGLDHCIKCRTTQDQPLKFVGRIACAVCGDELRFEDETPTYFLAFKNEGVNPDGMTFVHTVAVPRLPDLPANEQQLVRLLTGEYTDPAMVTVSLADYHELQTFLGRIAHRFYSDALYHAWAIRPNHYVFASGVDMESASVILAYHQSLKDYADNAVKHRRIDDTTDWNDWLKKWNSGIVPRAVWALNEEFGQYRLTN